MKFTLMNQRFEHTPGTPVYRFNGYDYGLSNDDTHKTGKKHISVTTKEDGSYPFFTVALEDLKEVN